MHLRILRLSVREGQEAAFTRFYQERVIPALAATEGCLYAGLLAPWRGEAHQSLTIWASAEHVAAYEWMMDYAGKVIAERRANPKDDLLSQFVLAEIEGEKLQDREVLLTTTTLIMAGIESLGGFMAMFALNLADFPDARRALAREPARIPDARCSMASGHTRSAPPAPSGNQRDRTLA